MEVVGSRQLLGDRSRSPSWTRSHSPIFGRSEQVQGASRAYSMASGLIPIAMGDQDEPSPLPPMQNSPRAPMKWLDEVIDQRQSLQSFEVTSSQPSLRPPLQILPDPSKSTLRMPRQASGSSRSSASSKSKHEPVRGTWSTASSPALGRFPSLFRNFRRAEPSGRQNPASEAAVSSGDVVGPSTGDTGWSAEHITS
ncbi:hypothetical protein EV356DRAFT_256292 [Viridothelium virens]|uniref:Uncharacterized protein n=1 Tax=Viridothelium virens TaxID=1048519 RepID=A0A6A6H3C0_VIRVR|nr:hypothetical protein EV356DRAFT_256292 [Viridothelium virens]